LPLEKVLPEEKDEKVVNFGGSFLTILERYNQILEATVAFIYQSF